MSYQNPLVSYTYEPGSVMKTYTYMCALETGLYKGDKTYEKKTAFLIGNEGNGLKETTAKLATSYLKIPMEGNVESLNAAVASSVLMYEVRRQNRRE